MLYCTDVVITVRIYACVFTTSMSVFIKLCVYICIYTYIHTNRDLRSYVDECIDNSLANDKELLIGNPPQDAENMYACICGSVSVCIHRHVFVCIYTHLYV